MFIVVVMVVIVVTDVVSTKEKNKRNKCAFPREGWLPAWAETEGLGAKSRVRPGS